MFIRWYEIIAVIPLFLTVTIFIIFAVRFVNNIGTHLFQFDQSRATKYKTTFNPQPPTPSLPLTIALVQSINKL